MWPAIAVVHLSRCSSISLHLPLYRALLVPCTPQCPARRLIAINAEAESVAWPDGWQTRAQIRSLSADAMAEKAPPIWSSKPTMLIGIDVSHPQSMDPAEPSIVGIVASMDRSFSQCGPTSFDWIAVLSSRHWLCARGESESLEASGGLRRHVHCPPVCKASKERAGGNVCLQHSAHTALRLADVER